MPLGLFLKNILAKFQPHSFDNDHFILFERPVIYQLHENQYCIFQSPEGLAYCNSILAFHNAPFWEFSIFPQTVFNILIEEKFLLLLIACNYSLANCQLFSRYPSQIGCIADWLFDEREYWFKSRISGCSILAFAQTSSGTCAAIPWRGMFIS